MTPAITTTNLPKLSQVEEISPDLLRPGDFYFNVWGKEVTRKVPFSENQRKDLHNFKIFTLKKKKDEPQKRKVKQRELKL